MMNFFTPVWALLKLANTCYHSQQKKSGDLFCNSNQSFPHYVYLLVGSFHQAFEYKKPVNVENMSPDIVKGLQLTLTYFECPIEVVDKHIAFLDKCAR